VEDPVAVSGHRRDGDPHLFLRFTGGSGDLFNFNWWKFDGPGGNDQPDGRTVEGGVGSGGASSLGSGGTTSGVSGSGGGNVSGTCSRSLGTRPHPERRWRGD
jgi:arabinoxylan arabinofuranohydrolase